MQLFNKPMKEITEDFSPILDLYGIEESKRSWIAPLIAQTVDGMPCEVLMDAGEKLLENKKDEATSILTEAGYGNVSGDVAQWISVVIPMITRAFPGVIGPEIFGFQPTSTPNGLVFFMTRHYTNDTDNPAKPASSAIHFVSDGGFTVGETITGGTSGATCVFRFRDSGGNVLLVSDIVGTFQEGEAVSGGTSAHSTTLNTIASTEIGLDHVFKEYNEYSSVALAEQATTNMKEVELKIQSKSVAVKDHQIKVKWTRQMEYDLRQLHGKDAEAILSNAAAQEFALSLNQKMLSLVKASAAAGGSKSWDYDTADGRWEVERYQNLLAVINRTSAEMLVDNHIGQGNFIIIDPITFASLDTMGLVDRSGLPGGMADPMVNPFSGILGGRYRVYQDIFETANAIYVGYKDFSGAPDAELKAGYFLSMYKAIDSIKMYGEESGHPRKIFETRYALTANPFGASKFYRKISVVNLPL
jgi:hypothetical protein